MKSVPKAVYFLEFYEEDMNIISKATLLLVDQIKCNQQIIEVIIVFLSYLSKYQFSLTKKAEIPEKGTIPEACLVSGNTPACTTFQAN